MADGLPDTHAFPCTHCGAELHFDADAGRLHCSFCGSTRVVEVPDAPVLSRRLEDESAEAARGLGMGGGTRSCRCGECGATVAFAAGVMATRCVFCGSAKVLQEAEDLGALRPFGLLPFGISRRTAEQSFLRWLGRRWLSPRDLRSLARTEALAGIYVPFYLFDAHVNSSWTAMSGHHVPEEDEPDYTIQGQVQSGPDLPDPAKKTRRRRQQRIRWQRARGRRADDFRDVPVSASHGVPAGLLERLSTFDTRRLVPYAPPFLAGWQAEGAAIGLGRGYQRATAKMRATARQRCAADVPGDTHRDLQVHSTLSAVRWKYVLLPVWLCAYRYRQRVYQFLVNGQTGEVVGHAPWSWAKITLLLLAVAALVVLLYHFFGEQGVIMGPTGDPWSTATSA